MRSLIWGYYGHYNLGDEAMLAGMLTLLRQWRPDLGVTVYSNHPADTQRRHGTGTLSAAVPRRRREQWQRDFQQVWQTARSQYFVLGGGDLLRDGPGEESDPSVAEVWLRPLARAQRLRCKTLVWGVSVGELSRSRTLALNVLNNTQLIAVRDQDSRSKLLELGVTQPIQVVADLALWGLPQREVCRPIETQPLHLGLSYRSLDNRPGHNADAFTRRMAAVIDALVERYDAQVYLLPLQAFPAAYRQRHRPAVDDYESSFALLKHCQHCEKVQVIPYFESLDAFLEQLSNLHVVIGTRLHSVILAASLGIPVIAADYAPKVSNFMAEIDQAKFSLPAARFSPETVLPKLDQILSDLPAAQDRVTKGTAAYRQRTATAMDVLREFWA